MAAPRMTDQEIAEKVPELREKFFAQFEEVIKQDTYDQRDLQRVREDDPYISCFIRAFETKGDLQPAVKKLDDVLKFRQEIKLNDLTIESFPKNIIERESIYWKGVNKDGQKIMLFRVDRHQKGQQIQEAKNYIAYLLEQHHRAHPGERIVLIFDFSSAGVTNMDLDVTRFIITSLSTYFPSILAYILLFEMSMFLSTIWKVIRSWLSEEQKNKITLIKKNEILNYVDAAELEPHMVPQK